MDQKQILAQKVLVVQLVPGSTSRIKNCIFWLFRGIARKFDVQFSAMQTHLHSKLLVIWISIWNLIIISSLPETRHRHKAYRKA